MGRSFEVDILSASSISKLQQSLKQCKRSIKYKTKRFAERLADCGADIARTQIVDLDAVFTGELLESLYSEYEEAIPHGAVFAIVADNEHAAFVEFGTGQKGEDTPYPYPLPDGVSWSYNVGQTIKYNSKKGTYYWFYPGKDGLWHYTEGMPARPFMYNTSVELAKKVVEIAKEVFSEVGD